MRAEFEELSEKIDLYFSELSEDQLHLDLKKAGYEYYRGINIQIFSDHFSTEEFTFSMEGIDTKPIHSDKALIFDSVFTPDNYDFDFRIAA